MRTKYVYAASIIILIITAIFSTGYHHYDEHFQILEFAGLKLKLISAENLPWEYQYQIRSATQPAMVVVLYRFFNLIGIESPFMIAFLLRLISAALAFLGMHLIYKMYRETIANDTLKKWFLVISFLLWFAIYNNVRFSSENWSGSLFIIAFVLLNTKSNRSRFSYLYIGFLIGLSFLCRYQIGFLIFGLILYYFFIKKEKANTAIIILGIIVMIAAGIIIDRWYYGNWTLTMWNYIDQNIIHQRAADFGVQPWWFYFYDVFIRTIPPGSIIIVMSFFLVLIYRRKDVLTWTILPFLLIHCIFAHKEIRFLFPIIGFVPIVIIRSIEIILEKWDPALLDKKIFKVYAKLFIIVNFIFLSIIAFKPANQQISLFHKVYFDYSGPTIFYSLANNPYSNIYFYRRANLEEKEVKSVNDIKLIPNKNQLFVTDNINIANSIKVPKKLIYTTYPAWLLKFNFNNWEDRTSCWYVYKLF
jgi:phosphatidylinositol glycan class B